MRRLCLSLSMVKACYSDEYFQLYRDYLNARHKEGGMAILFGNLAPEGAVVKQSAVSDKMLYFRQMDKCVTIMINKNYYN